MSAPFGMVPAQPLGSVAAASLTTSWRGAIRVTAVLKATFAFAPGGEMPLVAPADVVPHDVHFDDAPVRSVKASSDLCPALEKADVLFRGHAHATAGPVTQSVVRLAVAGSAGIVLDKRLVVIGDRAGPSGAPAPFAKMRICYERAAGGPDDPHNPIGVGFTGGSPNVLHADPARAAEPAGFGPLSAGWPCRRSLLRGRDPFAFDRAPVALPDDLDWSYFQSAPADQRIAELPEGAWLLLEGLHPEHASLRMHLPHLSASARLYSSTAPEATLALRADTLFIDGEAQQCTVTWRGSFALPSAAALPDLVAVAAGIHAPGKAPAWPPAPRPRSASSHPKSMATMPVDPAALAAAALPFQAAPAEVPAQMHDTLDEQPSPIPRVLPFQGAPPSTGAERAAAPAIEGAPWSGRPVAQPVLEAPDDGGTMLIRGPGGVAPPALVAPPAPVPPLAYVEPAPAPPPPAPAPTPPTPAPAPAAPRIVQAEPASQEAPPRPPPPARARPPAPPPPPQPRPIEPVPRVPVPSIGSRKAYTKFESDK